tara:strand:- start:35805 stop:36926 length:1122 start_codon:yes stop_codon:yes gene_type:complete
MRESDDLEFQIGNIDIYNTAPCGFLSSLSDGKIVKINDTLLQIMGLNRTQVLNKMYFQEFLNTGGKIYYETHYSPRLIQQKFIKEINFQFITHDKEKISVLVNTVSAVNSEGEVILNNSAIVDISQRKLYEQELLFAKEKSKALSTELVKRNEQLENYARIVTHDIKVPLANITGILNMLTDEDFKLSGEEQEQYLGLLGTSFQNLNDLVDSIFDYYQTDKFSTDKLTEIDLEQLLTDIISLIDAERKVEFNLVGTNVLIKTNKGALKQILLNLLVNAIKYNDKLIVKVGIVCKILNEHYLFEISDNGVGIKNENIKNIFALFSTLNTIDRFKNKGTGVGLASAKRILDQIGGDISVTSEVSEGSTFSFRINR